MLRKGRIFWPLVSLLLLADCTTKELAVSGLEPYRPHEVVGEYVRFTLAFNRGAAMSLSAGVYSRFIFSALALLAVMVLAQVYRRTAPHATSQVIALALVMGGAMGNLVDRVRSSRGVVDFIDVGIGDVRFWTFNVADIGVTTGALLLAWCLSRAEPLGPDPAG